MPLKKFIEIESLVQIKMQITSNKRDLPAKLSKIINSTIPLGLSVSYRPRNFNITLDDVSSDKYKGLTRSYDYYRTSPKEVAKIRAFFEDDKPIIAKENK